MIELYEEKKNDTHYIHQIKVYYEHHAVKYLLMQNRNEKKVDRNLTFLERARIVPSLLLDQYNILFNYIVIELYEEIKFIAHSTRLVTE